MEQALVDKLKNGTLDDIDRAMVIARLKFTEAQIDTVLKHISDDIHTLQNICAEHNEEAALLGFTFVCAFDSDVQQAARKRHDTHEENDAACVYALGSTDNVKAMCRAIDCLSNTGERGQG